MGFNKGKTQRKSILVFGVGINDSQDSVYMYENNNNKWNMSWKCPFYSRWVSMIQRCYSEDWLKLYPSYIGCSVCDEWLYFSNFKEWMMRQPWEAKDGEKTKHMDKDVIIEGNKIYSPSTTAFISPELNLFIRDTSKERSTMIGVSKKGNKFQARCNNPFLGKRIYLGRFETEIEAHMKWKEYKNSIAQEYADKIEQNECNDSDIRVANALRTRYL